MPKHIHSGAKVIEVATSVAVCIFNVGFIPILKMITLMRLKVGPEAYSFAVKRDNAWIELSEIRTSKVSEEARRGDWKRKTRKMPFSMSRKVSCMQQEWSIE